MTFLQPVFLAALAAVAIPLLLHLISRWQSKRVDLGTTRFLLEILHDQAHRKRIRRWLLLALRMAVIALLVLLFARPSLPKTSQRDGDRMRLILIDRSASMAVRSGASGRLIDAAVGKARQSIEELGPDAKIEVAFFDSGVVPLGGGISDLEAPKTLIAGTRLANAMRWARDRCLAHPNDRADVIIMTDLQRSGLDGADDIGMPADVEVRLIDVGREVADNLAVLDIRTPQGIRPPGKALALSATIFNFGPADHVDIPVIVTARRGAATHYVRKTVTVPSQQAIDVEAELVDLAPGRWEVTLDVDSEDDLLDDNRRRTAVVVAEPADVLVLDGGNTSRDETYFLRTALAAQRVDLESLSGRVDRSEQENRDDEGARFRPEVIYLDEATRLPTLADYPLVIVADPGQMLATEIESLHGYVAGGGRLIVFAGPRLADAAARDWEESGLAPGMISKPRRAGTVPYRMTSWDRNHPMLEPFADPQHGDLSRLAFQSAVPVKPSEKTVVLASFEPDLPAITEHEVGQGRVVWCNVPATRQWGNWTASPLYLPIIQQMSADLLGQTGEGPIRQRVCGNEDLTSHKNQLLSDSRTDARRPGFYPAGQALTVVNLPADESDITRMEPSEFYESFALATPESAADETSERKKQMDAISYDELWPWLLLTLLGLMVAEYWVAGRTPG